MTQLVKKSVISLMLGVGLLVTGFFFGKMLYRILHDMPFALDLLFFSLTALIVGAVFARGQRQSGACDIRKS